MSIILRTPTDIGALIRDRRRGMSLSQAQLAQKIGVSRLWVNELEAGKSGASLGLVLRALAAVGAELTSVSPEPQPASIPPVVAPDIDAIIESRSRTRKR